MDTYENNFTPCDGFPEAGFSATAASAASVFKPGIAAGVSLAALAGMTLASRGLPEPKAALLCITSIMLAAMGSGALNTVLDSEMDKVMPRLVTRVISLERLGRLPVVLASVSLVGLSLVVSYRAFGALTALLILSAALCYTVLYTLYLKRRSPFGTVPGGIPGALPVLIGYSTVSPHIGPDCLALFVIMLLWQPPHFLALALKYRSEYARAGVPVMPVELGERFTVAFMFVYMSALVPASVSLWLFGGTSALFALVACCLGIFYLAASYLNVVKSRRYGRAFAASIVYIMVLLIGLLVDAGLLRA